MMTACFAANKIQLRYVAVKMNMRDYNREGDGGGRGGGIQSWKGIGPHNTRRA